MPNKVGDRSGLLDDLDLSLESARPITPIETPRRDSYKPSEKRDEPKEDGKNGDKPKERSMCAKIMKFLFSEVGLVLVVISYLVIGALLFMVIEGPEEAAQLEEVYQQALNIDEARETLKEEIILLRQHVIKYYNDPDWIVNRTWALPILQKKLNDYHTLLAEAIPNGYIGEPRNPDDVTKGWSIASSLLFATTIMTSIGYGHVAPITSVGRLVCILYSLLALPMTSIFLIRVGDGVAKLVRTIFLKCICIYCGKRRIHVLKADLRNTDPPIETSDEEVPPMVQVDENIYWDVEDVYEEYSDYQAPSVPATLVSLITAIYLLLGTIVFTAVEAKWTLISSFYCCVVTLTTIGFGDMVPGLSMVTTTKGQIVLGFSAVYIMIGLAVLGMFMSVIGETMEKMATRKAQEEQRQITLVKKAAKREAEEGADMYGDKSGTAAIPPPIA